MMSIIGMCGCYDQRRHLHYYFYYFAIVSDASVRVVVPLTLVLTYCCWCSCDFRTIASYLFTFVLRLVFRLRTVLKVVFTTAANVSGFVVVFWALRSLRCAFGNAPGVISKARRLTHKYAHP